MLDFFYGGRLIFVEGCGERNIKAYGSQEDADTLLEILEKRS